MKPFGKLCSAVLQRCSTQALQSLLCCSVGGGLSSPAMQIFAVSDIHTDYKDNLSWCVLIRIW